MTAKGKQLQSDSFPEEQLSGVEEFDSMGFFITPDEDFTQFSDRVKLLRRQLSAIKNGDSDICELFAGAAQLPQEMRNKAQDITWRLYRFRADWVPAYFSTRKTGRFSAGVQFEIDRLLPIIFLHGAFRRTAKFRGYDADETLAHEMIHAVRIRFSDSIFEEYFPCRTSKSKFRRKAGNAFRKWYIPTLFFGGLFAAPLLFFLDAGLKYTFLPLLLPFAVLVSESIIQRKINGALERIRKFGYDPFPLALRLSDSEIYQIAKMSKDDFAGLATHSLRWRMLLRKFALHDKGV